MILYSTSNFINSNKMPRFSFTKTQLYKKVHYKVSMGKIY